MLPSLPRLCQVLPRQRLRTAPTVQGLPEALAVSPVPRHVLGRILAEGSEAAALHPNQLFPQQRVAAPPPGSGNLQLRGFLGGGQLCSQADTWGILCPSGAGCATHRGAPTGRRAPSVLPRSPSPPRPCAAPTAQTLVAPLGAAEPAGSAWPRPVTGARALHRRDGATCLPSRQPGVGAQPVPAPQRPALRHPESHGDPCTHPCSRWPWQPAAAARTGQGYPQAKCWRLSWCSPRTPMAGAGQQGFISARGWGGAATHITFGY